MSTPRRIELPFRARFDESGADGRIRSSGLLRYAQEAAWVHSESAGFDRRWYGERGLTWLVRCIELDLLEGIGHGERFEVSTEVIGWRRVWARRRSEFHVAGEARARAIALIDWVLVGRSGAPARVPSEIAAAFAGSGIGTFTPARVPLSAEPPDAFVAPIVVRRQDIDPMGHVNNAAYLDYFDDALSSAPAGPVAIEPRRYRLEYLLSADLDSRLTGVLWLDDRDWTFRLRDTDRGDVLTARLEVDPGLWVGG